MDATVVREIEWTVSWNLQQHRRKETAAASNAKQFLVPFISIPELYLRLPVLLRIQ